MYSEHPTKLFKKKRKMARTWINDEKACVQSHEFTQVLTILHNHASAACDTFHVWSDHYSHHWSYQMFYLLTLSLGSNRGVNPCH